MHREGARQPSLRPGKLAGIERIDTKILEVVFELDKKSGLVKLSVKDRGQSIKITGQSYQIVRVENGCRS